MNSDVIGTMRCNDPAATPAEGSIRGTCSECKAEVWIGPVTQRYLVFRTIPIICIVCIRANHAGEFHNERPVPEVQ